MENNEITLKRMRELLNEGKDNEQLEEKKDETDFQKIMNYQGYSIGFCGNSLDISTIFENFKVHLQEAQGVYIKFSVNENITASTIGSVVEDLHSLITGDLIFATNIDNTIDPNIYEFQILLTGLKRIKL